MKRGLFKPATPEQIRNRPPAPDPIPDAYGIGPAMAFIMAEVQRNILENLRQDMWKKTVIPWESDYEWPDTCAQAKARMWLEVGVRRIDEEIMSVDLFLKPEQVVDHIKVNVVVGEQVSDDQVKPS
jgi:hypothetical protein